MSFARAWQGQFLPIESSGPFGGFWYCGPQTRITVQHLEDLCDLTGSAFGFTHFVRERTQKSVWNAVDLVRQSVVINFPSQTVPWVKAHPFFCPKHNETLEDFWDAPAWNKLCNCFPKLCDWKDQCPRKMSVDTVSLLLPREEIAKGVGNKFSGLDKMALTKQLLTKVLMLWYSRECQTLHYKWPFK